MSFEYILTLSCEDRKGVAYAISGYLFSYDCNVFDIAQKTDSDKFFMRIHFEASHELEVLQAALKPVAADFKFDWTLRDVNYRPKLLIMVSNIGHCLSDLLCRHENGLLAANICAVASNHKTFERVASLHGIPFHYLPLTPDTKRSQEELILQLVESEGIDLVVLARYMQVFSPELCDALHGRVINIHHSFLPSFKGAKPYWQAYQRGVRLVGATAHFVTPVLDEGPIIEQDVARVDFARTPAEFSAVGRDVEKTVLGRAVQWFIEQRICLNGNRTVVFR